MLFVFDGPFVAKEGKRQSELQLPSSVKQAREKQQLVLTKGIAMRTHRDVLERAILVSLWAAVNDSAFIMHFIDMMRGKVGTLTNRCLCAASA